MPNPRIAPLEYALAYLAQQAAPLVFRPPNIPRPAHRLDPPAVDVDVQRGTAGGGAAQR